MLPLRQGLKFDKEGDVIANNVKYLREKNKMTQAELAQKIKISQYHLGAIERNEKIPSLETLNSLAYTFEVTVSEIIGEVYIGLGIIKRVPKNKVEPIRKLLTACEVLSPSQICTLAKFVTNYK